MSALIHAVAAVPVAALALSLTAAPGVAGAAEKTKPVTYPAAFSFTDARNDTALTVTSADADTAQAVSDAADVRKVQVKSSKKKGVRVVVSMAEVPDVASFDMAASWTLTAHPVGLPVPIVVRHAVGAPVVEETGLLTPVYLPSQARPVVRDECLDASVSTYTGSNKVVFTVPRSCMGDATALTGFTVDTTASAYGAWSSDSAKSSKKVPVRPAKGPGPYVDVFNEIDDKPGKDKGEPVRDAEFFSR